MTPIGDLAALVLSWSDEINTRRSLTDAEVDGVCLALWVDNANSKHRPWSSDEDERLVELTRSGLLAPSVALELGRSAQAVRSRIKRMKRTCPGLLPIERTNQYSRPAA